MDLCMFKCLLYNVLQCPFDRQQTILGNNGVWELKKNFALIELIERIQNQENSQTFSTTFLVKEREVIDNVFFFCKFYYTSLPTTLPHYHENDKNAR